MFLEVDDDAGEFLGDLVAKSNYGTEGSDGLAMFADDDAHIGFSNR